MIALKNEKTYIMTIGALTNVVLAIKKPKIIGKLEIVKKNIGYNSMFFLMLFNVPTKRNSSFCCTFAINSVIKICINNRVRKINFYYATF